MTLPSSAPEERENPLARWGAMLIALLGLAGFLLYLCPPGSWPVGYDVFWNLHLAGRVADGGLPAAAPAAAFTPLAESFADRQIGFHAWLALWGADEPGAVPWMLQLSLLVQFLGLLWALRLVAPRMSPMWLLLLPLVSATWLFRITALRDMPMALGPLFALLGLLCAGQNRLRLTRLWLFVLAALYAYLHAAVVLPLGLTVLVLIGRRLESGRWAWGDGLAVGGGLLFALIVRPDVPQIWSLLWTLNVRLPLESLSGENPLPPLEYAAYPLSMLLRWELGSLLLAGLIVLLAFRNRRRWALWIPTLITLLAALASRRLFELAGPLLLLTAAAQLRDWRPRWRSWPWLVLPVAGLAALLQLPLVERSTEANRQRSYPELAKFLLAEGRPGDLVFTFDWADSAGLAWACGDAGLRFTGMSDPMLMLAHDPKAFAAWWSLKSASASDPVRVLREELGARFVLIDAREAPPGMPPGHTASWLYEALAGAHREGLEVQSFYVKETAPVPGLRQDAKRPSSGPDRVTGARILWRLGPRATR